VDIAPDDHVLGPPDAAVTLLEYGDFECPYCGAAYPVVREVRRRLPLRFVFRHYPVVTAHPHAQRAAETAEWAASRDRFWPMHDLLYEHQDALADADLLGYARALGLDPAELRRAWDEHTFLPRIKADFHRAIGLGVTGTPAFFVGADRYRGPVTVEDLVAALTTR
jgi:protein-disulfide isomerase